MPSQINKNNKIENARACYPTIRAVIIDDVPASMLVYSWLLRKEGYDVTCIGTKEELTHFLADSHRNIDVFVVDTSQKNLAAPEIITLLNEHKVYAHSTKVVLVDQDESSVAQLSFAAGVVEIITKPFNTKTLVSRIAVTQARRLLARNSDYTRDILTGLPNYAGILTFFEKVPAQEHADFFVVSAELANITTINNLYGWEVGDYAIIALTERFRSIQPVGSFLARYSSKKFCFICPGTSQAKVEQILRKIKAVASKRVNTGKESIFIQLNLGYALSEGPEGLSNAQQNADLAANLASSSSGYHAISYTPAAKQALQRAYSIRHEIETKRLQEQFEMYFQPQVNISTYTVVGYEALFRWSSPSLGSVSPAELFPILENSEQVHEIGLAVFQKCFIALRSFPERTSVAVNVSARQLSERSFADDVVRLAKQHGVDPSRIEIEITESGAVDLHGVAKNNLSSLVSYGFPLVLDDFGVGYANLNYLLKIPLKKLKLDRVFIQGLATDSSAGNIVKSLCLLTRLENIELLAEGVETREEHRALTHLNVSLGQGYFYGRPEPLKFWCNS